MDTLDDLLIKRRRGTLQPAEARRLAIAVQASREHRLALQAGDAFDAEGAPGAGDEELVRRLVGAVHQRWFESASRRPVRRLVVPLAGALMFVAGAAAASYGGFRVFEALRQGPSLAPSPTNAGSPSELVPSGSAETVAQPLELEGAHENEHQPRAPDEAAHGDEAVAAPSEELSVPANTPIAGGAPGALSLKQAHGPRRQLRAHRRLLLERVASETPDPGTVGATTVLESEPTAVDPASEPEAARREQVAVESEPELTRSAPPETAAAMFQRAQRLRRSDWYAAELVYRRIVDEHPATSEAGVAEMVLAKRAFATGRHRDALIWFRTHERRGESSLSAEALWGQARALEALGRVSDAQAVWRRLIERHPASPYAPVARERVGDDP